MFHFFDNDASGKISAEDLQESFAKFGQHLSTIEGFYLFLVLTAVLKSFSNSQEKPPVAALFLEKFSEKLTFLTL